MRLLKISFAAIVLMSLAACGGGDGGGSNDGGPGSNNSGSKAPAIPMVSGEFKSSLITGQKFPEGMHTTSSCDQNRAYDRYFESEQVLVFANSNRAIDSDYQYVASSVQNQLADVLSKMNLTLTAFKKLRPAYTPNGVAEIIYLDVTGDVLAPEGEALRSHPDYTTNTGKQYLMRRAAFYSMSRDQQVALAAAYKQYIRVDLASMAMPEKIVVCIDDTRTSNVGYGEGTLAGMEIAANSIFSRSDINQIVYHELVHTIQGNVASPNGDLNSLDRWFLEGQAVTLSGQKVATKPDGFNPTNVISSADENPAEASKYYEHYGLAYSFLAKHNSAADFHNMFMEMRTSIADEEASWGVVEPKFEQGFENHMKVNGLPLILSDFKTNYLQLVK